MTGTPPAPDSATLRSRRSTQPQPQAKPGVPGRAAGLRPKADPEGVLTRTAAAARRVSPASLVRTADDRGSVALIVAILTVAMLAFAGLVIDGGAALAARGRAANLAQEASRAGAGALVPATLRGSSPDDIQLDPGAATAAAQQVLAAGDASGDVTVSATTVTVTARVERRSVMLSAFGVDALTGTSSSTAAVVYGTTEPETIGAVP